MNNELIIDSIVRQTMVLVAQLATTGGVRASLSTLGDQSFYELTRELQRRGVTTKVIADMFGMAQRTYHRRVHETQAARAQVGGTVWQEVLEHLCSVQPAVAHALHERFRHVSAELIAGVLSDLVHSGLARRSGWGERAVYRATPQGELMARRERPVAPESGEVAAPVLAPREAQILDKHRALLAALLAEVELGSVEPVGQVEVAAQTG